jgi:hypothetical protein
LRGTSCQSIRPFGSSLANFIVRHEIATAQLLRLAMTATLSLRASVASKLGASATSTVRHEIGTAQFAAPRDDGHVVIASERREAISERPAGVRHEIAASHRSSR